MDQFVVTAIFLSIFLINESTVSSQFYFNPNYYHDLPRHALSARQYKNVRFGHQNPILAAPTMAPQINSVESEENPRDIPNGGPFFEPSWSPVFNYLPATTTSPKISIGAPDRCPVGYVQSWEGRCILRTNPHPALFDDNGSVEKFVCPVGQIAIRPTGQCIPTTRSPPFEFGTTLRSPPPPSPSKTTVRYGHQNPILVVPTLQTSPHHTIGNNYGTVTRYFCPIGQIAIRPTGQCVPTTSSTPLFDAGDGYRSTPHSITTTRSPPFSKTTVLYGHQNPILVAPTLQPWPTASPSETTSSTLSPCDQGSPNHRLDPRTNLCFALGSVEPCGGQERNLAFYARESDWAYGECDCILGSSRPLVYHKETDTCYFVYQQAYCEEGQWLALNNNGAPNCTHNPCYEYGQLVLKWDFKRNSNATYMNTDGIVPVFEVEKCVPLGQICHRLSNGTLVFAERTDPSQNFSLFQTVLMFQPGSLQPTCHPRGTTDIYHPPNNILPRCRPGSKSNILGLCNVRESGGEFISDSQMGALVNEEFESSNFAVGTRNTDFISLTLLSFITFF